MQLETNDFFSKITKYEKSEFYLFSVTHVSKITENVGLKRLDL